jgi:hypothetical protein
LLRGFALFFSCAPEPALNGPPAQIPGDGRNRSTSEGEIMDINDSIKDLLKALEKECVEESRLVIEYSQIGDFDRTIQHHDKLLQMNAAITAIGRLVSSV